MIETGPLSEYFASIAQRKERLGMTEDVNALQNSGEQRTPAKRDQLRRIDARARAAGIVPIKAKF